ncbi:PepSY domain-containing protein [Fictibacillus sp. 7GRE50]|uniref:PepSY domain-containing protein n=1 Tax=unclassified Fictibacillus TaxID=2644029 RepID=UPI0018CF0180|nr:MULTISPECIES: PepSY domain-containing protein [unclassified Fictibacillus]MBH0166861.1 PepSY domain-containing protein [Fictibacillus sp. 7GRE50]MBH0173517.1 PepSY domain-containing protein [Fictibacillus sp. 23RED33]
MKKLTKIIAGTVLVGGIGVGTYTYVENTPSAFAAKNVISEKQAKDIALEKTKGGTIAEMELDRDGLKDKYEIEVHNGDKEYDLDIAAETGKISKIEEGMKDQDDNDDDGDDDNNSGDDNVSSDRDDQIDPAKIKITSEQAQSIALKKVSGTIKEMSLDDDYVYEFEIQKDGKDVDVNVDAVTGEAVVDENDNN